MRRILVTGANKGIGLAIVSRILAEHDDAVVLLGSRNAERGATAARTLLDGKAALGERISVLEIEVTSDDSVTRAAANVVERFGPHPLYAIVNNAGIAGDRLEAALDVNTKGVHRVCEAFLRLLDPERGRVVNVTSAAGPNFVGQCSEARQRFFLDGSSDWPAIEALMRECIALEGNASALQEQGFGKGEAYGLSKALTNLYTLQLARRFPKLKINACTPGFIETDLTRGYAASQGKTPAELGMKSPHEGAASTLFLLFGDPEGNGRYYGSDSQRSPLDRYRSPGSPPYTGD